ncbi:hypothetical protein ACFLV4_02685 [Chloroflexota bacterium]
MTRCRERLIVKAPKCKMILKNDRHWVKPDEVDETKDAGTAQAIWRLPVPFLF